MLLHCDLPVAEPIAHDELGDGTVLSRRATEAVTEQVRRDRNHPSIVLWSAMNELGLDRAGTRDSDVYEQFARTLYAAVTQADPTRPVIENDWVEPDPDRVFNSPVLTAHWYGRLHADYLDELESKAELWFRTGRPLLVTEFGDWGLPGMPAVAQPPFWDARATYTAGLAGSGWPGTIARFIAETQRYQGVSDRLQIEVFRRHEHIGGYCLTELTDVPHEFNGLLDLHRQPKPNAVAEVSRANATILPMLEMESLVAAAEDVVTAGLVIANDGPTVENVLVEVRFGDTGPVMDMEQLLQTDTSMIGEELIRARFEQTPWATRLLRVEGHRVTRVGDVSVDAPRFTGSHDLQVIVTADGVVVGENRYPVHVVR